MKRPRQVDFQRDTSMGLAPGGLMRQEIYADKFGIDAWDQANPSRCFVHILNSEQWQTATGKPPPANPEHPDTTWAEAVGWALLSGAVIGTARMLATRKAAEYYRHSTGHLPPKLEKVS